MRENQQKQRATRSSLMTLASILDLVTTCPKCGGEVGIWSEDAETLCTFCQYRIFDKERTIH